MGLYGGRGAGWEAANFAARGRTKASDGRVEAVSFQYASCKYVRIKSFDRNFVLILSEQTRK